MKGFVIVVAVVLAGLSLIAGWMQFLAPALGLNAEWAVIVGLTIVGLLAFNPKAWAN